MNRGDELRIFDPGDVDDEIDAVEDGSRELMAVGLDLIGGAGTGVGRITEMAAGAGIHSGNKHKISGVGGMTAGAGNRDGFVLEGTAKGLKDRAGEFGKLVQEENTMMGERNFTRSGGGATADN